MQSEAASYYLLEYQYVPDIVEKRAPYRAAHLAGAQAKVGVQELRRFGSAWGVLAALSCAAFCYAACRMERP